jgi:carbamoyltransferase
MYTLGINSAYHESSVSLLKDGDPIFFLEEERINRIKRAKPAAIDTPHLLPEKAIQYVLEKYNLTHNDFDYIAFSFAKEGRLQNIGIDTYTTPGSWGTAEGEKLFHQKLMLVPGEIDRLLGSGASEKLIWVDHHLAHAASAFLCSPYSDAITLVIDGIGEINSISAYYGQDNRLEKIFDLPYPHSLGFLWEKFCQYLGFTEYDACKLMGLSSYGDPEIFATAFSNFAQTSNKEFFSLDNEQLRLRSNDFSQLETLFGPARNSQDKIFDSHKNIAATLQQFTEEALLKICKYLRKKSGNKNLCLAGGTALNCVANSVIQKDSGFENIFIQPAANDAGTALGAALFAWSTQKISQKKFTLNHPYWGPEYSNEQIKKILSFANIRSTVCQNPAQKAAQLISEGNVVAWFQGKMEMGPRALGNRSLLADPRRQDMRDILNKKVKHREEFRPFAPSILKEQADKWFEISANSISSDFMLFAYKAKSEKQQQIPAVVHIDGTSRIQTVSKQSNPLYHSLINYFYQLTEVPLVLNTSFNDSEPIVMSPQDALATFQKTDIDALFLGSHLILKQENKT